MSDAFNVLSSPAAQRFAGKELGRGEREVTYSWLVARRVERRAAKAGLI